MAAIVALLDVTAEHGGAAVLDRGHGVPLCRGQRCAVLITKSRAEVAEHVRHFQPFAGHKPGAYSGIRSGRPGRITWRDSSGLAVAKTVLVAIMRYRAVVLRLR